MVHKTLKSKKVQARVQELCDRIRARYPEAEFKVFEGDDPRGIYIYAYTEDGDFWGVMDLVSLRSTEILEQEGIFISVVPLTKKPEPVTPERP